MSALLYFSMTSCNSIMDFGGFIVSLEEHGPGLTPVTVARITTLFVMSGVLALS